MSLNVAVLGLGIMGAGMAHQLVSAGHRVTVWNRTAARAEPLVAAGASLADTPAQAARDADFVIAMVADNHASRDVWLGADGALAAMKRGSVAIDCSTLDPDWVAELGAAMSKADVKFVEAPVTGSKAQAESGTLRFFVGAEESALTAAQPVLNVMGTEAIRLGPVGSGAVMKLANNFLSGLQAAAFAEALALIEAHGLDATLAADILRNGSPGSPMIGLMADRMLARDYTPNFLIPLMAKDLGYAERLMKATGIRSQLAGAARARFQDAADAGLGDRDISAVVEHTRVG